MPHLTSLVGFALVSLGMVLTPGPNMIYLISRSITQGPAAGIVSLGGVALGFVFYICARHSASRRCCLQFLTPTMRCALQVRPICCGSPGRRSGPAAARRSRSESSRSTGPASYSRWGS